MTVDGLGGRRSGLGSSLLTNAGKPRRVFFSFHYQKDISRVQVVKNHWITKGTQTAGGFFDGSLEEKAKTQGEQSVKALIDAGMGNSSVTCVLIGAETYKRRWVHYEIFRSIARGAGLFGVRIHNIKDFNGYKDAFGINPFSVVGYGRKAGSDKLWPIVKQQNNWIYFPLAEPISLSSAKYLTPNVAYGLEGLFRTFDWMENSGFDNFATWVAMAASQAGR